MQGLVDDAKILLVVDEARVGVDLRIHPDPELHIPLELRGACHGVLSGKRRAGTQPERADSENEASGSASGDLRKTDCRVHLHLKRRLIPMCIQ